MPLVSQYPTPRKQDPLEELALRKARLREQIESQKQYISRSGQQLLTPVSIVSYVITLFSRKINIYDGVVFGFKMIQKMKDFFHKS